MTPPPRAVVADVDPFDLPAWLGEDEVTWSAASGLRSGHCVTGELSTSDGEPLACDLLAVDDAYPQPVADETVRARAHQAWRHGQVLLISRHVAGESRLTLAVPGTRFDADRVLDALARLAKAVGGSADRYTARLRIGSARGPAA